MKMYSFRGDVSDVSSFKTPLMFWRGSWFRVVHYVGTIQATGEVFMDTRAEGKGDAVTLVAGRGMNRTIYLFFILNIYIGRFAPQNISPADISPRRYIGRFAPQNISLASAVIRVIRHCRWLFSIRKQILAWRSIGSHQQSVASLFSCSACPLRVRQISWARQVAASIDRFASLFSCSLCSLV